MSILLLNARKKRRPKRATKSRAKKRNPAQKRRAAKRTVTRRARVTTRKGSTMAKRKKRRTTKRRARRNPSRARRTVRRVARRTGSAFMGLNFRSALKDVPTNVLGMMAAKWAAKRFGEPATETDPESWNYASYLKGAGGAAVAGILMNMLKPGWGQKVLQGGLSLMAYKLIQNELVTRSEWATGQFGQAQYAPGDVEANSEGEPYILGEDYEWYPIEGADDYRRIPEALDDALVRPGPLGFGGEEELVRPGPLGFGADIDEAYKASFLRR